MVHPAVEVQQVMTPAATCIQLAVLGRIGLFFILVQLPRHRSILCVGYSHFLNSFAGKLN